MPRSYLFAHPEETLDGTALQRLTESIDRRRKGEPIAYITGFKEFWSLELLVTSATLVPRPETELLVDLAGVPYMDSSGVASLVEAYQSARQSQGFFGLAAATPGVVRVLELARLDQVFNVFPGIEEGVLAAS